MKKPIFQMDNELCKNLKDIINDMNCHLIDKHAKIQDCDRNEDFEEMQKQWRFVTLHFDEFLKSFNNFQK